MSAAFREDVGSASGLQVLHRRLGHRRLHPAWGKVEILLGLGAVALGLLLGEAGLTAVPPWRLLGARWLLIVLGGYLALAGHRSHLYRSLNEHTALLIELWNTRDRVAATPPRTQGHPQ